MMCCEGEQLVWIAYIKVYNKIAILTSPFLTGEGKLAS